MLRACVPKQLRRLFVVLTGLHLGDLVFKMWQEKVVAMLPPSQRADFESRLKLYREDKPYRELPQATPDAVPSEDSKNSQGDNK